MSEDTPVGSLPFDKIYIGESDARNPQRIADPHVAHQVAQDLLEEASHLKVDPIVHLKRHSDDILPIVQAARFVRVEQKEAEARQKLSEETQKKRYNEKWGMLNDSAYEEDLVEFVGAALTEESFRSSQPDLALRHVIKIDMQMLNYFNALPGGHQSGDDYKHFIADTLSVRTDHMKQWDKPDGFDSNVYITGGDEFSILAKGDRQAVERFIQKVVSEVREYHHPQDDLGASGVDCGIATLGDIVTRFGNNEHAQGLYGQSLEGKRIMIAKLANHVADRQSEVNKFMGRILFLQRVHREQPTLFDKAYQFGTKGAFQISKEHLMQIIEEEDCTVKAKAFIANVFEARDRVGMQRGEDPLQKVLFSMLSEFRKEDFYD